MWVARSLWWVPDPDYKCFPPTFPCELFTVWQSIVREPERANQLLGNIFFSLSSDRPLSYRPWSCRPVVWRLGRGSKESTWGTPFPSLPAGSVISLSPSLSADIREFTKPRRQRERERRWTKELMNRTKVLHVRYNCWYISLPSSSKRRLEMTKFSVVWRTWTTAANFEIFISNLSLCSGFSFSILLTVMNNVNDFKYRKIRRETIKWFFNQRCPRRRRCGFVNSLLSVPRSEQFSESDTSRNR